MEHVGSLARSQDLATAQYAKRDQSSADPTNLCTHVATTLNFRGMISKLHSVVFLIRTVDNMEIVTTPTAKHRFPVDTLFAYIWQNSTKKFLHPRISQGPPVLFLAGGNEVHLTSNIMMFKPCFAN